MKSDDFSSPEDRLMHELLREQSRGPDAALLRRIESTIDSRSTAAKPRPAWGYPAAAAAAIALLAGGASWFFLHGNQGAAVFRKAPSDTPSITLRPLPASLKQNNAIVPGGSNPGNPPAAHRPLSLQLPDSPGPMPSLGKLTPDGMQADLSDGSPAFSGPSTTPTSPHAGTSADLAWRTPLTHPVSAFPLGVDTSSYPALLRMIAENRPVSPAAVRIDACVNAFRYHDPQPRNGAPFALGTSIAPCPWNPANRIVRIAYISSSSPPTSGPAGIAVEFNPARVAAYRLLGNSDHAPGDKVAEPQPNAVTAHPITALFEITPADITSPRRESLRYAAGREKAAFANEWLVAKLSYEPGTEGEQPVQATLKGDPVEMDDDFRFATAAAMFAMKLRGEPELETIPWSSILADARACAGGSPERAEFVAALEQLAANPVLRKPHRPATLPDAPLRKPR